MEPPLAKGRGAQINPPNRFGGPWYEADLEQVEHDQEYLDSLRHPPTEYIPDNSKTIVTENNSPDVGFRYSINPYRGWRMAALIVTLGPATSIWAGTPVWTSRPRYW